MYIKFNKMAKKLAEYNRVMLYGTGHIARIVYEGLQKQNIEIQSCVVTTKDEDNQYFMDEIPIYQMNEYIFEMRNHSAVVMVAVSEKYEPEIAESLYEAGIKNYLLFSDFCKNDSLTDEYDNKTADQCIEEIAEWQIERFEKWHIEYAIKYNKIREEIKRKIINCKRNKNKIVMAVGDLSPRVVKISKALLKEGKEIKVLIYPNANIREVCKTEMKEAGISVSRCDCIEELIYSIITEQASIVHMFSCGVNTSVPYILIKMKTMLPPIVYDEYDILNEFYCNIPKDKLKEERFCLENAAGICKRGYELDYLSQQCGYHFNGKTIQFFDWCKDEEIVRQDLPYTDDLSLCYVGGLYIGENNSEVSYGCWMEFIHMCEKEKCHLHIYPTGYFEQKFAAYIELEKKNKYFHLHSPVPYALLSRELSQYDYGIFPIKETFRQQEIDGGYTKVKMIYGVANKFFDYIDAGLPIIAAAPIMFAEFFEKQGVLIPWTIERYDFEMLRKNKKIYRERIAQIQEKLRVKNHIRKLIEFYDSL